ncbi:MAG: polysaccharide export protein [Acidobacteriota bacterium]|nr:polysaccharide export protein [Acidobacteriota bacterium]
MPNEKRKDRFFSRDAFLPLLVGAALGVSGGHLLSAQELAPAAARPTHILGPEDQITIRALHAEEISDKPIRIDPAGDIRLPLVGRIHAAGKTLDELQRELTTRLKTQVREPEVSVSVVEYKSQPVSVVGAVKTPGVYQLQGAKTLIEMLSAAGGTEPDAGYRVKITRRREWGLIPLPDARVDSSGEYSVAEVNLQSLMDASNPRENLLVDPNDVISVPRAKLVYAVGEVRKPGGFVLRERETISVLQVLALAEGMERTANERHARILRTQVGGKLRAELPVDLKRIMAGESEDLALQPNDILFVPNSAAKSAALRTLEAAIQMGTGVVIWRR